MAITDKKNNLATGAGRDSKSGLDVESISQLLKQHPDISRDTLAKIEVLILSKPVQKKELKYIYSGSDSNQPVYNYLSRNKNVETKSDINTFKLKESGVEKLPWTRAEFFTLEKKIFLGLFTILFFWILTSLFFTVNVALLPPTWQAVTTTYVSKFADGKTYLNLSLNGYLILFSTLAYTVSLLLFYFRRWSTIKEAPLFYFSQNKFKKFDIFWLATYLGAFIAVFILVFIPVNTGIVYDEIHELSQLNSLNYTELFSASGALIVPEAEAIAAFSKIDSSIDSMAKVDEFIKQTAQQFSLKGDTETAIRVAFYKFVNGTTENDNYNLLARISELKIDGLIFDSVPGVGNSSTLTVAGIAFSSIIGTILGGLLISLPVMYLITMWKTIVTAIIEIKNDGFTKIKFRGEKVTNTIKNMKKSNLSHNVVKQTTADDKKKKTKNKKGTEVSLPDQELNDIFKELDL